MGSTDVVRLVRRITRQRRVGHTGTLDPGATGVLIVCLGRGTRLVRFLQEGRKTYLAEVVLGVETTTQDTSGEVVAERSAADVDERALCAALAGFVGDLEQVPPMVSAVKVGGERLYEKARRGEVVERTPRRVTVHELVLESFQAGRRARATLLATCSSGTYVRTLAHDLGRALGCGGSLGALRRLANGPFTLDDAVTVEELERRAEDASLDQRLLSLEQATRAMPQRRVGLATARAVASGRPLPPTGERGPVAVVLEGPTPRLLGVYSDRGGQARPEAILVQPAELP
ncbi:MAG TPA: tRNA pseudouridine(55) synthase TruB, partial [Nitriliruptorales bacterium]|nr:tRNA pseudouridine(55) synthase TruB [Nitriliruptorales bacterium]